MFKVFILKDMGTSKIYLFSDDFYYLSIVCKGLAHPARISILEFLFNNRSAANKELVTWLGLAQSTVSQHLEILIQARLIKSTVMGTSVIYKLDEDMISKLSNFCNSLFQVLNNQSAAPQRIVTDKI